MLKVVVVVKRVYRLEYKGAKNDKLLKIMNEKWLKNQKIQ